MFDWASTAYNWAYRCTGCWAVLSVEKVTHHVGEHNGNDPDWDGCVGLERIVRPGVRVMEAPAR